MRSINYLIVFFIYLFSSMVFACSCATFTLAKKVNLSDNIFLVETNRIETIEVANVEKLSSGTRRGHFKVLNTLKGVSTGFQYIESDDDPICCMCGSQVKNNTQYLVFNSGDGKNHLSSCGFTQSVSNVTEISEIITGIVNLSNHNEIFTGIYLTEKSLFLNDDGTKAKVFELNLNDYYADMSRVSFEGIKLPSGNLLVKNLQEESTLLDDEILVVNEILENETQTVSSKGD